MTRCPVLSHGIPATLTISSLFEAIWRQTDLMGYACMVVVIGPAGVQYLTCCLHPRATVVSRHFGLLGLSNSGLVLAGGRLEQAFDHYTFRTF